MAILPAIPAVRTVAAVVCVFFAAQASMVRADEPIQWKTGAEFAKALRAPIDRTRNDRPIGESLTVLSRDTGVAILLDRRVDPNQLVSIDAHGISLADELKDLASTLQLGVGTTGAVQYFGPKTTAARVEALSGLRRRDAAASGRKAWLSTASSSWDDLAEPRELAQEIANTAGATISNPETIPHDVWAAWSGPALSHVDRLTLVLAGFELTFALSDDGKEVTIQPAPSELTFERSYDVAGIPAAISGELKRLLPDIKVQAGGKAIRVTATAEQHAQVADLLAGKRTTTKTVVIPGEQVYSFKAENQLIGAMVQTLARQRGFKVQAAESIVEKLKQRATVEVQKASFEEALKKVLDPVGIKYKLTDTTLELSE